ncbi:hypothetical protein MMPV_007080 [Pyropia vietnamensis]
MAPLFRRLPTAAAVAPVLWVVAAAAAVVVAANGFPPVIRMRPIEISGTYTTIYSSNAGVGCPSNFTIGQGEPFSKADNLSAIAPHPNLARNFLGSALSEEGVPCTGGALVAISSIQAFNPRMMEGVGKPKEAALLFATAFSHRMFHWADVLGFGMDTVSCGGSAAGAVPRWESNTWVAIGEMAWSAVMTVPGETKRLVVPFGGDNRTAIFLNSTDIRCVMSAPPRRMSVGQPPVEDGVEDGEHADAANSPVRGEAGGKVSAGAAAGIGLAAAAVGLALGAAGGLSIARWHRRRIRSKAVVSRQASAAGAGAADKGAAVGRVGTPPSRLLLPHAGGAPSPPHRPGVGLVLPTFGEPAGVPPAAAAAATAAFAAKDVHEAFGLADAPSMPPELADSMAPPPMPDALRGSTITTPSSEARSGGS